MADDDDDLFASAMRDVTKLEGQKGRQRARPAPLVASPVPGAGGARFTIEGEGETLVGRGPGVSKRWVRERANAEHGASVDLHGRTVAQVEQQLPGQLRSFAGRSIRIVLLIHGAGRHSDGGEGVLRAALVRLLSGPAAADLVRGFTSAPRGRGGAGALLVFLA